MTDVVQVVFSETGKWYTKARCIHESSSKAPSSVLPSKIRAASRTTDRMAPSVCESEQVL